MAETSNFGILTNTSNIYDAVDNRNAATTEIIYDSKYFGGTAIKAVGTNQLMFDTGTIPAGTFSGAYNISIYYDCPSYTAQGQQLMRWAIYEDGVLMPEDTSVIQSGGTNYVNYEYDMNTVDDIWRYGMHTTLILKASSTYRITVTTSGSISTRTAILDYVALARQPENSPSWGRPQAQRAGLRNLGDTRSLADDGSQVVIDVIQGNTGVTSLAAGANITTGGYTYTAPFKSISGVWVTAVADDGTGGGHGRLLCTVDGYDIPNNQVDVTIRNVSDATATTTSSKGFRIKVLVIGYI